MDGSAVESMKKVISEGLIVEIDKDKFSPLNLKKIIHDPLPESLKISTLSGIVNYIKSLSAAEIASLLVSVESTSLVSVYSMLNKETMSRKKFIIAQYDNREPFQFGSFMDIDRFIIELKSRFVQSEDQNEILRFSSKVTAGNTLTAADDGVSQSVEVKRGMSGALREKELAPSVVSLRPYRTFREIEQPASVFIFRMRGNSDALPQCALFEADGGAWRIKAIQDIAAWLDNGLDGVTIIA